MRKGWLPAKTWVDVLSERDITRLFLAISKTHRASTIGMVCLDQITAQLNLLKVKQMATETLSALETRIKLLAEDVTENGLSAYTDQQLAGFMFRALDDEYESSYNECRDPTTWKFPKVNIRCSKVGRKLGYQHTRTSS